MKSRISEKEKISARFGKKRKKLPMGCGTSRLKRVARGPVWGRPSARDLPGFKGADRGVSGRGGRAEGLKSGQQVYVIEG